MLGGFSRWYLRRIPPDFGVCAVATVVVQTASAASPTRNSVFINLPPCRPAGRPLPGHSCCGAPLSDATGPSHPDEERRGGGSRGRNGRGCRGLQRVRLAPTISDKPAAERKSVEETP